jgi:hypothetical protein
LRSAWLRPGLAGSAPMEAEMGAVGPRLSARLPDRLLLCVPARSVGLWAMRLLALPQMVMRFQAPLG